MLKHCIFLLNSIWQNQWAENWRWDHNSWHATWFEKNIYTECKTSFSFRTSQSIEKIGIYKYLLRHTLVNAKIEAHSAVEVKGGEINFNWRELWKLCGRRKPHIGSCRINFDRLISEVGSSRKRSSLGKGQMIRRWAGTGWVHRYDFTIKFIGDKKEDRLEGWGIWTESSLYLRII